MENTEQSPASLLYEGKTLKHADWVTTKILNPFVWRCPNQSIEKLYKERISTNHLEVGVGTGFWLKYTLESGSRLALLDASQEALDHAGAALERHRPEKYLADVSKPLRETLDSGDSFESLALTCLFHLIPGNLELKAAKILDNLLPYVSADGSVFGATILGADIRRPLLAVPVMNYGYKKEMLWNKNDTLGDIMEVLSARFRVFNVEVQGCVVLFWGKGLKEGYSRSLSQ